MSSDYVRESVSRLTSVRIEIDGKYFEFPAALDDGADITLLGSNVWSVIADTGIVTANVSLPFKLANGSTACAIRSAFVDLHLQTSAGPVIARSSQVYFADGPLPDILLGRPLLLSLGINVEQQLCDLADRQKPDGEGEEVFDHRDIEHLGCGVSDNAEVGKALTHAVTLAAEQAPAPFVSALRTLLFEFVDVFRVKLGPDPPIDIEPALIELLPTAIPAHCKPRHMPPLYRDFLSQHFSQLVEFGYGFMNPSSSWSSPAFCVPKPGANRYLRSVCDLRYPNSQMKRVSYPMPHLLSLGEYLSESGVFFTLDAFKGFWQIPIAGDIESQSMSTPMGIFTPNRLPQGHVNSVFIFQHAMDTIFRSSLSCREQLIWVDDLLGHAPNPDILLRTLRSVMELCRQFRFKLNAARCQFLLVEAKWCGKMYFKGGWNHDPDRTAAIRSMASPRLAHGRMALSKI